MHLLRKCTLLAIVAIASGSSGTFSVDGATSKAATAVVTIQPRAGAPGYSWLRIYFYPSALTSDDSAKAAKGRADSITAKWSAVIQLTVDKDSTVWQINLSLPGHTCTIAESDRQATSALQEFHFDGKRLRLRGKGSHVCDMTSLRIPNQTFRWDVDVDAPVVPDAH